MSLWIPVIHACVPWARVTRSRYMYTLDPYRIDATYLCTPSSTLSELPILISCLDTSSQTLHLAQHVPWFHLPTLQACYNCKFGEHLANAASCADFFCCFAPATAVCGSPSAPAITLHHKTLPFIFILLLSGTRTVSRTPCLARVPLRHRHTYSVTHLLTRTTQLTINTLSRSLTRSISERRRTLPVAHPFSRSCSR